MGQGETRPTSTMRVKLTNTLRSARGQCRKTVSRSVGKSTGRRSEGGAKRSTDMGTGGYPPQSTASGCRPHMATNPDPTGM